MSDKPVGWVVHDPKSLETARGKIKTLYEALQSQAREIAEKDYRIASLETTLANDPKHWGVHKQIAELTAENAALTSQRDVAYGLIKAAKCPCCDGGGAYYGNMGEVCQCQWCYEAARIRGEK